MTTQPPAQTPGPSPETTPRKGVDFGWHIVATFMSGALATTGARSAFREIGRASCRDSV